MTEMTKVALKHALDKKSKEYLKGYPKDEFGGGFASSGAFI